MVPKCLGSLYRKTTHNNPPYSHRPLSSHLIPRCSQPYAEGRNEARCLADGVRGHSHFLGLDCYSAASSDHTLAACGAVPVGAAVSSGVTGGYTRSAPPFVRFHSHRGDKWATHTLTGRAQPLPAATATVIRLLTKVGSGLDAACGAVGAAVPPDVCGESESTHEALLRSSASIVTVVTKGPHTLSPGVRSRCQLRLLELQGCSHQRWQ